MSNKFTTIKTTRDVKMGVAYIRGHINSNGGCGFIIVRPIRRMKRGTVDNPGSHCYLEQQLAIIPVGEKVIYTEGYIAKAYFSDLHGNGCNPKNVNYSWEMESGATRLWRWSNKLEKFLLSLTQQQARSFLLSGNVVASQAVREAIATMELKFQIYRRNYPW